MNYTNYHCAEIKQNKTTIPFPVKLECR